MALSIEWQGTLHWRDYWALTKPRVVALLMVTAVAGMVLGSNEWLGWAHYIWAFIGLWAGMASAAVVNQWVDQRIDAIMQRTQQRPLVQGQLSSMQAVLWAAALGISSMLILVTQVNVLTAWLTALGMVGYAGIYTRYLKRATPQNIVIGGISGALPPLLGWTAVSNDLAAHAWLLVLIIFVWTPPHFWALAIHRREEYAQAGIPMLPVTHGVEVTKDQIFYYTVLLLLVSLLPYLTGMSGGLYLLCALWCGLGFMHSAWRLKGSQTHQGAMKTFGYSIVYLFVVFAALLLDKLLMPFVY